MRLIAEENLKSEMASKKKKFCPATVVQEAMKDDPSRTRKALRIASTRKVKIDEDESQLENLKSLPRQGQMMRITTSEATSTWAKSIQSLPRHVFKFALNATHDVPPPPPPQFQSPSVEETLFQFMPTLPPARSEPDSCPEQLQGRSRSLTI